MTQRNNILQELKGLESSLAGQPAKEAYSVPAGYFQDLAGKVLARIKALESGESTVEIAHLSSLLAEASRQMPYTVPAGYFEELEAKMLKAVLANSRETADEELKSISPLLAGLKKDMPYHVPQGYFQELKVPAADKSQENVARIVSFGKRKWLRYAAAAVITGMVLTTGLLLLNQRNIDPVKNPQSWVNKNLKKVSTDEISNFIQLSDETLLEKEVLANTGKNEEVKSMLQDVSDREIQEFLNDLPADETGSDEDIMLN